MYEAVADPYCYASTTVLKNRRGLRDQAALDRFEVIATTRRAEEPLPAGTLSSGGFRLPTSLALALPTYVALRLGPCCYWMREGICLMTQRGGGAHFEPIHQGHAIEQVAFVIQFEAPLSDDLMAQLEKAGSDFGQEFPRRAVMQGLEVSFGPTAGPAGTTRALSGMVWQRFREDGNAEAELRCERTQVTFRTLTYTRWEHVWSRARRFMVAVLPIYTQAGRLNGVSLSYVDKFVWKGPIDAFDRAALIRDRSPYVAPHVYEVSDQWHCHSGSFTRSSSRSKRLLNVNIDVLHEGVDSESRRVVAIATLLTDFLNQPGYEETLFTSDNATRVCDTHMEELHLFAKEVLSKIITDDTARRIQLMAP